jgi:hypothetical protein
MKNADMPAMPISEEDTDRLNEGVFICTGLTKREYFAAHAPVEPHQWFKPVMDVEFPLPPKFPSGLSENRKDYVREFVSVMKPQDGSCDIERKYISDFQEFSRLQGEYAYKLTYATCVQWPLAYADALLAALEKTA